MTMNKNNIKIYEEMKQLGYYVLLTFSVNSLPVLQKVPYLQDAEVVTLYELLKIRNCMMQDYAKDLVTIVWFVY